MSKTTWESYHRTPRGWILNDGTLVIEPMLEITEGGRRVRTDHHLYGTSGPTARADDVAFTWVVKHAHDQGKVVMCQQHTPEHLMNRVRAENICMLPGGPPLYHKVGDRSSEEAGSGRWEYNKTSFWSLYKHPDLPVWFISLSQVSQSYQGINFERSLLHFNLFPKTELYSGLYNAPQPHVIHSQLNRGEGGPSIVNRPIEYFVNDDFFERFAPGRTVKQDGLRAGLRRLIIEATRELQDQGLAVPDIWRGLKHDFFPGGIGDIKQVDWEVELQPLETNLDEEAIESLKAYASGEEAVGKALAAFREMRNALQDAGLVLGEANENDFLRYIAGDVKAIDVPIRGEIDAVPGGAGHKIVLDIVTGSITTTCPISRNDGHMADVRHAWEEASTIAQLSGNKDEFTTFSRKYLDAVSKATVLEQAFARRSK